MYLYIYIYAIYIVIYVHILCIYIYLCVFKMSLTETLPGTRCQSKCFDQKEVVCNKLGRLIGNNFCCAIHHCSALIND